MWEKKQVEDVLKQNPYFENLFVEGKGKYACMYVVNGFDFVIYYNIHGQAGYYFLEQPTSKEIRRDLQNFVTLAMEVCQEIYKVKGGNQ